MTERSAWIGISMVLVIILFSGCKKFDRPGNLKEPGIVLTFDDDRVDNWYRHLPMLDSAGVRATFYISNYNRLSAEQKRKLVSIRDHGHEIAFHSTNHYNMMDYVYKYNHTIDECIKNEVEDGLKMMNRDGFYPITFAYPMGAHNGLFDKMLQRYFKSVRALNGTNDYSKSLVPTENNKVIFGLGIDKSSKRTDEAVLKLIRSASENGDCAVFVAHNIDMNNSLSVTRERLVKIFSLVNSLGLKYYTVTQISN